MTLHDEPPVVELDELLDEQEEADSAATGRQWALVVVGGVIGIAGMLTLLVATTPVLLDLVAVISDFTRAVNGE